MVATFLGKSCHLCLPSVHFVAACLSLWCWELDVDLIVSVPEFTYLLCFILINEKQLYFPSRCLYSTKADILSKSWLSSSRKHTYIILTPLKPHFYTVKLGFIGYTLCFLFLLENINCEYSLELPLQCGSNEYPQSMFWAEIWNISEFFIWTISFFDGKIFSIIWIGMFSKCYDVPVNTNETQ